MPSSRLFLGLVPWYGLLIVLGAGLAIWLADREAARLSLPKDTIIDLALWALPLGILGARLYYVFFTWEEYRSHPVSILYLWEGGLAIYGGIIAGIAVVFVFAKKRRISPWLLLDILAPGVALAQAIGRWGNFFNQEAYGIPFPERLSFLAFFPLAVTIQEPSGPVLHIATFFLESFWNVCVFLFLIRGRRTFFRKTGDTFLFYLLFYGAGRLWIENLRMDSLYLSSSVRISQLVSLLLASVSSLVLLRPYWSFRQGKTWGRAGLLLGALILLDLWVLAFCLRLPLFGFLQGSVLRESAFLLLYALLLSGLTLAGYRRKGF